MKPTTDHQLCVNSICASVLSVCLCVLLLFGEHSYWNYYYSQLDRGAQITIFVLSTVFIVLAALASFYVLVDGIVRAAKKESLKTVIPLSAFAFFQFLFQTLNARAVSCMGYIMVDRYDETRFANGFPGQGNTITLAVFAILDLILACVFLSMLKNGSLTDLLNPQKLARSASKAKKAAMQNISFHKSSAFCPYCGAEVSDDTKFCPQCGKDVSAFHQQPAKLFCPGCGTPLETYSAFCPNCGCDLSPLKEDMGANASSPAATSKASGNQASEES